MTCLTLVINKKNLKIQKGGNQNPYMEEEQTTQWPKEKVQKDKQRIYKPKIQYEVFENTKGVIYKTYT